MYSEVISIIRSYLNILKCITIFALQNNVSVHFYDNDIDMAYF